MLSMEMGSSQALGFWKQERILKLDPSGKLISAPEETRAKLCQAETILHLLFQTLDSLYVAMRSIPTPWTSNRGLPANVAGTNIILISMPLPPENYLLLRTILSLISDVYLLSYSLLKSGSLMELESPISLLSQTANKFRDIRNFFAHLNDMLLKPSERIAGACQTDCGIEYGDAAKECFHLVLVENSIHFSHRGKAKQVDVGKWAFNDIFESARLIYAEVTSHKLHSNIFHYPLSNQLYPL